VMSVVWLHREDCETDRLPDLCLRCGRPAKRRVAKDFRTTLVWSAPLTFLLGGVEGWTARVPMCSRHRLFWCRSVWPLPAAFFGGPVLATVGFAILGCIAAFEEGEPTGALCVSLPFYAVYVFAFFAVLGLMSIHATEMHENGVRLANVHKDF